MTEQGMVSWKGLISSTTTLSQVLAGVLVTGYLGQFIPGVRPTFALVAGRTIPRIWNIFTSGLLEVHLSTMVLNVLAVLVLSKHIEPVYGSKSYLKFLAIVLSCSGFCAFVSVYLAYALDRNQSSELLFMEICGFHGVTAGMLVAVKQIVPDSEVTIFKLAKLRAKHLASLYILTASIISLSLKRVIATMPFVLGGTYSAWFYLRFLQPSTTDPLQKGDNSPDFSFASFYPLPLQPFVEKVADFAGNIFKLGRPGPPTTISVGAAAAPAAISAEASRRRERGQRALEERLGSVSMAPAEANRAPASSEEMPRDIETGHGSSGTGIAESSEIQVAEPPNREQQ